MTGTAPPREGPPQPIATQIAETYRRMAEEARYRPTAPSDGLGNITMPIEELDLDAEAVAYGRQWWREEDERTYLIGCPGFGARAAMIYALEAARLCCGGADAEPVALRLAKMAVAELEQQLDSEPGATT